MGRRHRWLRVYDNVDRCQNAECPWLRRYHPTMATVRQYRYEGSLWRSLRNPPPCAGLGGKA